MIFVLGGTIDARFIVERIAAENVHVKLHTLTQYGASLASENSKAQSGALNSEQIEQQISKAWAVVDASHPYAVNISKEAMDAAKKQQKPYLRFERKSVLANCADVYFASTHEQAAQLACELCDCGNIFLTIGTRGISPYIAAARAHERSIFARILPVGESLHAAREVGLEPGQIVAMQGPISSDMEKAFLRNFGVDVLVTKDSGMEGGVEAKLEAARSEGVKVVVVEKPKLNYPWQTSDVETLMSQVRNIADQNKTKP